ncbi:MULTISPECIES: gluconate 2-dehydrogenase subunit 3 family protein [Nosocomiicoccus]|uniref:Gluconate 2-dehydrogenase subunit 3 family protein n=1 Tax=Nosocomiicoccus massiliensis TaxID=1232430 RepID=A0AAF0YJ75_9STAP|nr:MULTISPECIES: gluconate 2-dehydrogenase subunit 3 family protein [Nosocomiicoccus]MDK6863106.1 gluconate 2-dehydrogenase subunit 3 family protein [Nosocomiicoccus ampullae]OFO55590.1 hypothetical protein HMPREF3029_03730 [Nosocomiicoccus sp. HMSC059G07]OFS63844.1 hypothetical protein HMPREF3177_01945 [Nosocomiicoccus sp. HMSC09A07]WOS96603.1 gluconate 2-dehydrogenase subunit 3 family protein [Nosocomiicoccus massiliensis]
MAENKNEKQFSRRDFLKTTGVATGGIIGGSLLGGLIGFNLDGGKSDAPTVGGGDSGEGGGQSAESLPIKDARTYFSRQDDFKNLAAAADIIYPEDDNGPGATELGVPYFIDRQMYGHYGHNATDYRFGPFEPMRSDTHGRQERITRGEMMIIGLRKLTDVSQEAHDKKFHELEEKQMIDILKQFEAGEVETPGMRSEAFFELLRSLVIEGVYSDPVYGGNRDMAGWKMIGYPGPRMGWEHDIMSEEFLELEPESLRDYQGGGVTYG